MAPWVKTPPKAILWLARLGLISGRWTRIRYMRRPLEWTVDPATLPEEQRLAVLNTDLWALTPGSYEAHSIGFKRVYVMRSRYHLANDKVMVCTWKSPFDVDISKSFKDRQDYVVVGNFLKEYSSVVPGKITAGYEDVVKLEEQSATGTPV